VSDLYTLTSHHKTPVELLVLESSPVSTNDQIKVEAKFDPNPPRKTGRAAGRCRLVAIDRAQPDAEIQRGLRD